MKRAKYTKSRIEHLKAHLNINLTIEFLINFPSISIGNQELHSHSITPQNAYATQSCTATKKKLVAKCNYD